jgi:hypothetical protein
VFDAWHPAKFWISMEDLLLGRVFAKRLFLFDRKMLSFY